MAETPPTPDTPAAPSVAAQIVRSVTTTPGGAAIATGTTNIIADMIEYLFDCHDAGQALKDAAGAAAPHFMVLMHPSPAIEFQMATGVLFLYHGIKAALRKNHRATDSTGATP